MYPGIHAIDVFQSTLPMKGATCGPERSTTHRNVSIHAPNEGSDQGDNTLSATGVGFNPRSQ